MMWHGSSTLVRTRADEVPGLTLAAELSLGPLPAPPRSAVGLFWRVGKRGEEGGWGVGGGGEVEVGRSTGETKVEWRQVECGDKWSGDK